MALLSKYCSVCGAKMTRLPYVNDRHPYSSRTGKLVTKLREVCPNEKCDQFYNKKVGIRPGGDDWVWIGNFSDKAKG
jgi:hypothetical protein